MNMKEKLSSANDWMQEFSKKSPEKMKNFHKTLESIESEGALSKKNKELISISISIIKECEWCIAFHVNGALEAGATEDEIIEAAWVAVLMGGGPALMHAGLVLDALEDLNE